MIVKKLGQIWAPKLTSELQCCYGILPSPIWLESEKVIRVFFGSADSKIHSRVYYLDLSPDDPTQIIDECDVPILDLGKIGTFDDSGVVPSCVIKHENLLLMYTVGFQRTVRTPYMLFAGLATSNDDGRSFRRFSEAPILPRVDFRHIGQGAPCVIIDNGVFRMWHWFATKWITVDSKLFMDYQIGYAESKDGINWNMAKEPCLQPKTALGEFAIARPWVVKRNDEYIMLFSSRRQGLGYRIGQAKSNDGISWNRMEDEDVLPVSKSGWDADMVCYTSIVNVGQKNFLFYNGNDNGKTGFGVAEIYYQ